jgi:hypothetical protein
MERERVEIAAKMKEILSFWLNMAFLGMAYSADSVSATGLSKPVQNEPKGLASPLQSRVLASNPFQPNPALARYMSG